MELLIATEGMGVYKVDVNTCKLEHYIVANYQSYNEMNGNNINDVFVDEEKRIWLANYPTGITIIGSFSKASFACAVVIFARYILNTPPNFYTVK